MTSRLNDKKVRTAPPGRYYDGKGLILRVRSSGSRDWALRVTKDGKTSDYGLGGLSTVTLAEARDKAYLLRKEIKNGNTPERKVKTTFQSFEELAEDYIKAHSPSWKGDKSRDQWRSSLSTYAFSKIGKKSAKDITTADVLSVLRPIWESKNETANRVRGRIEKILDSATAQGLRAGDNPARWQGHLMTLLPKPSLIAPVEHFAAMDYRELPKFWKKLSEMDGIGASALRWTILNAVRSGESRGARYEELVDDLWLIPSSRMKAGKEHRVPLTKAALAIIPTKKDESNNLLFPAPRGGKLSDMSLSAVLKRMGIKNVTVHGFRSTFRDWAGETTSHPREVIEHALAHQLKDKSEAAYARSDLLEKRRRLMNDWAVFVTGEIL
jgi:integrase